MTLENTQQTLPPQAVILDTVMQFFRSRVTQVFADLQIADAIAAGRATGVNQRFLEACAGIGLVVALPGGGWALTPVGEALRTDVPGSMRAFAASVMGGAHYGAWANLAHSARTGESSFETTYGEDVWSYFTKSNPAEGHLFNQAMAGSSALIGAAILAGYSFPENGTIVDVAGGNGSLLATILRTHPELRGVVMDLAFTKAEAERNLAAQGVADRCQFVAGDFFNEVPAGADLYTMKWILHDWSDEKAAAILRTVHRAMPAHAKLLVAETVVAEGDAMGRMMDVHMMVMCGGKERTERQWRQLLGDNGFRLARVIALPGPVSLIEVEKQ
jgi:hypothetical protein